MYSRDEGEGMLEHLNVVTKDNMRQEVQNILSMNVLLIKQVLYFDRYTQLLAPGLDVLNDERLSMNSPPPAAVATAAAVPLDAAASAEGEAVVIDID